MASSMPSDLEQRGGVVGAVGQPEPSPGADATAVATVVDGDDPEVPAQRLERLEPVEAPGGHEPVQQDDGRRAGRARDLPDERGAPAGELQATARGTTGSRRGPAATVSSASMRATYGTAGVSGGD